jgi:glycogen(starch) synthase
VHRIGLGPFPRDVGAFLHWVADMNTAMAARADELVARGDVDLVHSHDWLVADAARQTAARAGVPWLTTVHATEHGRHGGFVDAPPQSTIHAAERAMVHGADHLITCSEWMAAHVSEVFGVPRTRITALRNGVDLAGLVPRAESLPALRARLAPGGERLVLLVGRLEPEKGFDLALDALAAIAAARDDVRFAVAGAGTAEGDLRRRSRRLGLDRRGRFLGWIDDALLHSLYAVGDVCVVPSRYEPFGIVALEAMGSGCPCVVADIGGLREVVPADASVGARFAPGDATALRRALAHLLDNDALRARCAAQAREHARRFDWPQVAADTHAVFASMVTRAPAAA